jgi:hypothetical protein
MNNRKTAADDGIRHGRAHLPVSGEKLIEFLNVAVVDLALDGTDCRYRNDWLV